MKKLWLAHADVQANEDRIKDTNTHAASLVESDQFDSVFQEKRKSINERYERIRNFTANRQAHLNQALTLHRERGKPGQGEEAAYGRRRLRQGRGVDIVLH